MEKNVFDFHVVRLHIIEKASFFFLIISYKNTPNISLSELVFDFSPSLFQIFISPPNLDLIRSRIFDNVPKVLPLIRSCFSNLDLFFDGYLHFQALLH